VARLAAPTDRPRVAALLANTWRRHGVLALEDQIALLNSGVSTVAFARDDVIGVLGLNMRMPTGDPEERWVDIALVAVSLRHSPARVLRALLDAAMPALRARNATGLVCLIGDSWLRSPLSELGLDEVDQVISYMRSAHRPPPVVASVATLRPIGASEAETVLALNAATFTPFWRYDSATTLAWLITADHAVLAELGGRPAGFALTTCSSATNWAQLIRVATHPDLQRRGIGRQMVVDAVRYADDQHTPGLTLNTQASNRVARHMYEALDFHPNGQSVAVLIYRM
jgi:GNAT superfamily N-acetyltransferase